MKKTVGMILMVMMLALLLPALASELPVISGTAAAGNQLSVSFEGEATYQWYTAGEDEDFRPVRGATNAVYTIRNEDIAHRIKCSVTPAGGMPIETAVTTIAGTQYTVTRMEFAEESDKAAFQPITNAEITQSGGAIYINGSAVAGIDRATVSARTGKYSLPATADSYVMEAKVKFEQYGGNLGGGLSISLASGSSFKYMARYCTNPDTVGGVKHAIIGAYTAGTNADGTPARGATVQSLEGNSYHQLGIQEGNYVIMKAVADATADKLYIYFNNMLYYTIDCGNALLVGGTYDTTLSIAGGNLGYMLETLGGHTYIEYVNCYALYQSADVMAKRVKIGGSAAVGRDMRADFEYMSVSGKPEGTHSYQWQYAENAYGAYAAITDATAATYYVTEDMIGKYIKCAIVPVASDGTSGIPAETQAYKIAGKQNVGTSVECTSGDFTCYDGFTASYANGEVTFNNATTRDDVIAYTDLSVAQGDIYVIESRVKTVGATTAYGVRFYIGDSKDASGNETASDQGWNFACVPLAGVYGVDWAQRGYIYETNPAGDGIGSTGQVFTNTNRRQYNVYNTQRVVVSDGGQSIAMYYKEDGKNTWVKSMSYNSAGVGGDGNGVTASEAGEWDWHYTNGNGLKFRMDVRGTGTTVDYVRAYSYSSDAADLDIISSTAVVNETETSVLSANDTFAAKIYLKNYGIATSAACIIATYQNNILTGIKTSNVAIDAKDRASTMPDTLPVGANDTHAKIFVWDSWNGLHPLLQVKTIYIQ